MKSLRAVRPFMALAFAAAAATMTGCATINDIFGTKPQPAVVAVAPARLNAAERAFVAKAFGKSVYEVEVSRLAAERATDPRVRSYALTLVNVQAEATNELVRIMSAKGVAPPKGLPADKATKLHRLAGLPRSAAFDEGYVRVVGIEDHAANIALFESARRQTTDRDLLAWIDRTLPAMRRQLGVAQNLVGAIAAG